MRSHSTSSPWCWNCSARSYATPKCWVVCWFALGEVKSDQKHRVEAVKSPDRSLMYQYQPVCFYLSWWLSYFFGLCQPSCFFITNQYSPWLTVITTWIYLTTWCFIEIQTSVAVQNLPPGWPCVRWGMEEWRHTLRAQEMGVFERDDGICFIWSHIANRSLYIHIYSPKIISFIQWSN